MPSRRARDALRPPTGRGEESARVGVAHEYEILRRGIASCLGDDSTVHVVFTIEGGDPPADADVVVASPRALQTGAYTCPIVVCADGGAAAFASGPVVAVVPWPSLTPRQLIASVRAAAAGFRLELEAPRELSSGRLDTRKIAVLRLLAGGATTRMISETLHYSERTVKSVIRDLEAELRAATRAQAVAEALRRGLI